MCVCVCVCVLPVYYLYTTCLSPVLIDSFLELCQYLYFILFSMLYHLLLSFFYLSSLSSSIFFICQHLFSILHVFSSSSLSSLSSLFFLFANTCPSFFISSAPFYLLSIFSFFSLFSFVTLLACIHLSFSILILPVISSPSIHLLSLLLFFYIYLPSFHEGKVPGCLTFRKLLRHSSLLCLCLPLSPSLFSGFSGARICLSWRAVFLNLL